MLTSQIYDLVFGFDYDQRVRITKDYRPPMLFSIDRASRAHAAASYYYASHFECTLEMDETFGWLESLPISHLEGIRRITYTDPNIAFAGDATPNDTIWHARILLFQLDAFADWIHPLRRSNASLSPAPIHNAEAEALAARLRQAFRVPDWCSRHRALEYGA